MKNHLLDTFVTEYVEIITDLQSPQFMTMDENGQPSAGPSIPMVIAGFFMDMDEGFIYLSSSGEEVDQALPVQTIKHIQITPVPTADEETVFEVPDDGSFH